MMNDHEPPKLATLSAMCSPKVYFSSITWFGVAAGANPYQLLRRMELMAKYGQHIHTGHRFALQQNSDVVAADLHAGGSVPWPARSSGEAFAPAWRRSRKTRPWPG